MSLDDVKQLLAGSIAGACGKFVAYPFDTVKVRMQMHSPSSSAPSPSSPQHCATSAAVRAPPSAADVARQIMRNEGGLGGFYRGLAAPIAGAAFENATLFWGYALSHKLYTYLFNGNGSVIGLNGVRTDPSLTSVAFAGCMGGFACATVNTPVEMLKCTMQVEHLKPVAERQYTGVVDVAKKMIAKGGVASLYQGFSATAFREGPGNAAWFVSYNIALRTMLKSGETKAELPSYKIMFAGGCGGVMYWTIFFPVDVIKTQMQLNPKYKHMGFLRASQAIFQYKGYQGLYAGLGITLVRAFPANGVTFAVYEKVVNIWDKWAAH